MPEFRILTVNSEFHAESRTQHADAKDAFGLAVRSAMMIGADEITSGRPASAVEIKIEDADGALLLRSALMISVAPLAVGPTEPVAVPIVSNDT